MSELSKNTVERLIEEKFDSLKRENRQLKKELESFEKSFEFTKELHLRTIQETLGRIEDLEKTVNEMNYQNGEDRELYDEQFEELNCKLQEYM